MPRLEYRLIAMAAIAAAIFGSPGGARENMAFAASAPNNGLSIKVEPRRLSIDDRSLHGVLLPSNNENAITPSIQLQQGSSVEGVESGAWEELAVRLNTIVAKPNVSEYQSEPSGLRELYLIRLARYPSLVGTFFVFDDDVKDQSSSSLALNGAANFQEVVHPFIPLNFTNDVPRNSNNPAAVSGIFQETCYALMKPIFEGRGEVKGLFMTRDLPETDRPYTIVTGMGFVEKDGKPSLLSFLRYEITFPQ